ncbi:hypothetical protein BKA69DRAFT_822898 [Paraphysoderma sedebokerense]|nr:hypothetical protein BKA69DRAFT_822898 [Paraphysoderma sedebokerense]
MMQSIDSGLIRMKLANEARLSDEQKDEQRKKNLLVLIIHHLISMGYIESAEKLQKESNISIKKTVPADNVDLIYVLQEFETYYHLKFGRLPKFVRQTREHSSGSTTRATKQTDYNRQCIITPPQIPVEKDRVGIPRYVEKGESPKCKYIPIKHMLKRHRANIRLVGYSTAAEKTDSDCDRI